MQKVKFGFAAVAVLVAGCFFAGCGSSTPNSMNDSKTSNGKMMTDDKMMPDGKMSGDMQKVSDDKMSTPN